MIHRCLKSLILTGRVASPGKVVAVARIVLDLREVDRVGPGEVLVTRMTDPNCVPAMRRAGAVVTDLGGILCHAAIVARELGIPCIVGTREATKLLLDGDFVEVDAFTGRITVVSNPRPVPST
jgi:pyruvate,water dikinase